jgi:Putative metal-binding motif
MQPTSVPETTSTSLSTQLRGTAHGLVSAAVLAVALQGGAASAAAKPDAGVKTDMICTPYPSCLNKCLDFESVACRYANGCSGSTVCNRTTGATTCDSTGSKVACSACGAGGYQACSATGQLSPCRPVTPTTTETCNGCDDNANGQVDEGLDGTVCTLNGCSATYRCQAGVGQCVLNTGSRKACSACASGTMACNTDGTFGPCQPPVASVETCNSCDDDRNGIVDDLPPNRTCTRPDGCTAVLSCSGGVDSCVLTSPSTRSCPQCGAGGVQFCYPGGDGFGPCRPPTPRKEECNGCDDDLDGVADNNLDLACSPCSTRACVNGAWTACSPPPPELCNGKDDNCDGQIDEGGACNACIP